MRVLWLTYMPMPDLAIALGKTPSPRGGWMPALAEALVESGQVSLAVATNVPGATWRQDDINGVRYYTLPSPKGAIHGGRIPIPLIQAYLRAVEEFQPDVIHIHGTEYFHGLLTGRGYIKCPTVISIQGIIDVYQRYYWGNIPFVKLLRTHTLRDWVRMDGLIEQKIKWVRRAKWEREIFATNSAFIGRTIWDRAHTRRLNPKACYYHCDEIIREPFYRARWDIQRARQHQIFCSSANYPLKGFHVLLKSVVLLKDEFPDISVHTPLARFYPEARGWRRCWFNRRKMGYARYLTELIRAERLEKHIVSYLHLNAGGMVEELLQARVFVLPSFIENSPNSLAEAMLVGTPSVASFVGGVQSMAQDGESALFFPPGDEAVLAERLREIFLDDDLACRLSMRARDVARARHSSKKIVDDMLNIYKTVSILPDEES